MRNITIAQAGATLGILEWDDQTGAFRGFAADEVNECADYPQAHPAFPPVPETARKSGAALAVLLTCLGYDMPAELSADAQDARAGKKQPPAHTVA